MRAFTCSSQAVFCIFVVSKLWKMLVAVQPSLAVCGKCGCLCNKHNSCWSLLTLAGSHRLELKDPGDAVPAALWLLLLGARAVEGRVEPPPCPKHSPAVRESSWGWESAPGTLLCPAGWGGLLGLLWDAAVFPYCCPANFPALSFIPLFPWNGKVKVLSLLSEVCMVPCGEPFR